MLGLPGVWTLALLPSLPLTHLTGSRASPLQDAFSLEIGLYPGQPLLNTYQEFSLSLSTCFLSSYHVVNKAGTGPQATPLPRAQPSDWKPGAILNATVLLSPCISTGMLVLRTWS